MMTGDELRAHAVYLHGEWGWQTKLAADLQVDASSVRRWVSSAVPVPGPVEAAVRCFIAAEKKKRRGT